jgi:hypothetical protein
MKRITKAYFRFNLESLVVLDPNFNDTIVLKLSLPAGHYAVFGKVTIDNADGPQNATARLMAQDGAELIDQTNVRLGHFEGIFHNSFFDATVCVDVQGEVTVAAGMMDIIDLRCASFGGHAGFAWLIAMDVGDSLLIARANRIALKSFRDTVLTRVRLTRGRHVVFGKAALLNFDGDPQNATVSLITKDGAVVLTEMDVRIERNGDGHTQSVAVRALLGADDSDFVDLRCTTFNGDASDAVLMAIPVDDVVAGTAVEDEPDGRGGFAARRLAAIPGHQIVFGTIALPNLDGDSQYVTAQLVTGANADRIDETLVNIVSDGAALISTQGILQGAAAGDAIELDWTGFINSDRFFHIVPREASIVAIAVDRVIPVTNSLRLFLLRHGFNPSKGAKQAGSGSLRRLMGLP